MEEQIFHHQNGRANFSSVDLFRINPSASLHGSSYHLPAMRLAQTMYLNKGRVLWVKGNPREGKTMLLCAIIDEMSIIDLALVLVTVLTTPAPVPKSRPLSACYSSSTEYSHPIV